MRPIHIAYRIAQRLRLAYWWVFRPNIYGVKVVLLRDDAVLLVRHSYDARNLFMLPGGGINRNENAKDAARREIAEETGCGAANLVEHGRFLETGMGARNHITVFRATTQDTPYADGREIIEAAFFPFNALPGNISAPSLRRIREVENDMSAAPHW